MIRMLSNWVIEIKKKNLYLFHRLYKDIDKVQYEEVNTS